MDIEKPLQDTAYTQPLAEGYFFHNNLHTKLVIYPDSIFFANEIASCTYVITFDFSYDVSKEGNGWVLTIMNPQPYKFFSHFNLDDWDSILLRIMKRKRFHQFYKGVKKIGKGNFASVYLTERVHDNKLFAVKAFQKQSTFKPTNGKQGLQNEINILRKLNHQNITRLEGVFQTQNSIYLVMELIQGKSLGQILDQQKMLTPSIRKRILKGILAGLAEMQSKHIVHRDIKPENIMIDSTGQAKIVDFGLATDTKTHNYLYVRCGTPGFVAPQIIAIKDTEQAKMNSISDVFSAGAILYQMIFGRALFEGDKNHEVLEKNRRCLFSIPASSQLASYQQLVLLRRMLDVYPETRITASQALRANYFSQTRQPLQQIVLSQYSHTRHLPPLKGSNPIKRKARRVENNQN